MSPRRFFFCGFLYLALSLPLSFWGESIQQSESYQRGEQIYQSVCIACHQADGKGIEGAFPPLAQSDFLTEYRDLSIKAVLFGLSGQIRVNGIRYFAAMPDPDLSDQQAADVMTYVMNAWGNQHEPVSLQEVQSIRQGANRLPDPYPQLPEAPKGFGLSEFARLPENGVRLASDPESRSLYLLALSGNIYRFDSDNRDATLEIERSTYIDSQTARDQALGFLIDSKRQMYVILNQLIEGSPWQMSLVTIYRSEPLDSSGRPGELKPWFRTSYPFGNGGLTHGVSGMTQGPDGQLYINSGSRTDSAEVADNPLWWPGAETETTACIWKMDPESDQPSMEVFAKGIRNAWSLCFSPDGDLLMVDNGPRIPAPEELNHIEEGKHYGFPYEFGDMLAVDHYPHGKPIPEGLELTRPIPNIGPAAGGSESEPILSFDPHSSPAGFIYCDASFPPALRGKYLIGRFGSLFQGFTAGFDILLATIKRNEQGQYTSTMETFLSPLSRPLDIHATENSVYILEYGRQNDFEESRKGPGRILELSW